MKGSPNEIAFLGILFDKKIIFMFPHWSLLSNIVTVTSGVLTELVYWARKWQREIPKPPLSLPHVTYIVACRL